MVFQSCSFEQGFFFRESFLDHCSIWVTNENFEKKKKTEDFELLRKSFFLFVCKNYQRNCWCTNNFVQISFVVTSTCFEQVSRCQALSESFSKTISFLCVFLNIYLLNNVLVKNVFSRKTSVYLLLIFFTISIVF